MAQIYNKKMNNSKRYYNKISTNSDIFLSFFYLQPILYRKSPVESLIYWTFRLVMSVHSK